MHTVYKIGKNLATETAPVMQNKMFKQQQQKILECECFKKG